MSLEWQEAQLKMATPIYPSYKRSLLKEVGMIKIIVETLIRIEREGIYYLVRNQIQHIIQDVNEDITNLGIDTAMNMFHHLVYQHYILYKIDPSVIDINGHPLFHVDKDQRTEAERLTELLIH